MNYGNNNNQCDICADRGPCSYCGRSDVYEELNIAMRLKEYEEKNQTQKDGAVQKSPDEVHPGNPP